jgi:hypothetical protein
MTVAQLRAFLDGTVEVQFRPPDNDIQRYGFIESALKRLSYAHLVDCVIPRVSVRQWVLSFPIPLAHRVRRLGPAANPTLARSAASGRSRAARRALPGAHSLGGALGAHLRDFSSGITRLAH